MGTAVCVDKLIPLLCVSNSVQETLLSPLPCLKSTIDSLHPQACLVFLQRQFDVSLEWPFLGWSMEPF